MSKAFELAEIVRHFTYDADNGKFDTSKKIDSARAEGKTFSASSTSAQLLDSFTKTTYGGGQYFIVVKTGSDYQALGINLTHDNSTAYMNQFGDVKSGSDLATFSANVSGTSVRLYVTPGSAAATANFKVEYVDA